MQQILENIDDYKHIVIIIPDVKPIGYLASANALYTYLLQLHKKVSLYIKNDDFDLNMQFLPWISKLKTSYPSSADAQINSINSIELFHYFQNNEIKLNNKMATSLYAGLLYESNGFKVGINNNTFLMAQKLLENGADIKLCTENILNYQTLSSLRLKAILLRNMILKENGNTAVFNVTDEDLKMSGAKIEDTELVVDEALSLITVTKVIIIYKENIIRSECE